MAFETSMKIHFDEADPAGVAFSGGLFTKIHRCYEDFIAGLGVNAREFFLSPQTLYPLRHFEAEYLAPLLPLEIYGVSISVIKMGTSSFTLEYKVGEKSKPKAVFRSTHVAVNKEDFTKIEIPQDLKQSLEKFLISQ
jgi:acyl-CoA thioesterase FadM